MQSINNKEKLLSNEKIDMYHINIVENIFNMIGNLIFPFTVILLPMHTIHHFGGLSIWRRRKKNEVNFIFIEIHTLIIYGFIFYDSFVLDVFLSLSLTLFSISLIMHTSLDSDYMRKEKCQTEYYH